MAFGCCCQGCQVSLPPVDEFENITRVAAWPGNADTTPIEPYARGWYVYQDGSCILERDEPNATCGRGDGTQGVCYDMSFDGASLSPNWLATPGGIEQCAAGAGESVVAIDNNCYRKTGQQVNFSHSCTPGWKGVAAYAHWPGTYGLINSPTCDCATDADLKQQWKYAQISSKIFVSATYNTTRNIGETDPCGGPAVGAGGSWSKGQTIDWYQTAVCDQYGNVRRSGRKNYSAYSQNSGFLTIADPGTGCTVLQPNFRDEYAGCDNCTNWNGSSYERCSLDGLTAVPVTTIHKLLESTEVQCGVVTCTDSLMGVEFVGTPEEFRDFIVGYFGNLTGNDGETLQQELDVSLADDKFTFYCESSASFLSGEGGPGETLITATLNAELTIALQGQHTFAAAMADCISLLDTWPLWDDATYPWRTDSKTWLMPYVQRDAAASSPDINWQIDENCEFIDQAPYSGEVRGAPLPAGMGYHFDYNHINWMRNENAGTCNGCEDSLGAMGAAPVPKTATHWTDYNDGSSMTGPGAHVQQRINANYSTASPGPSPTTGVRMQKWVETLEEWPSTNFMRPFGDDRWRMDMDAAQCITSITGTTLDLAGPMTGVSAGDLVVIYGGPLNAQIWTVSSVGTGPDQIVLGTQFDPTPAGTVETLVQASMDEWANHGDWGTNGLVGKLRWQYDRGGTRYPWQRITGRDMAITVDAVDTYKITTPSGNQAVSGDKVAIYDASAVQVGGTMYIKRLTDTTAELYTDTALTVPAVATGAVALRGYEASYISQAWNTDASRNTVIVRENNSQLREADLDPMVPSFAETLTQYTLSRVAIKQCVFCASPNSQDTTYFSGNGSGSLVFAWDSGRIDADMCPGLGEEWHLDVIQAMNDPLWQTPDINCGSVAQEASPCAGGASTYKYPALVEPLLSTGLPASSPTIPGSPQWYESGGAPSAVGTAFCVSQPRDRGTVHNIRTAWAGCQNQKDQRNHGL